MSVVTKTEKLAKVKQLAQVQYQNREYIRNAIETIDTCCIPVVKTESFVEDGVTKDRIIAVEYVDVVKMQAIGLLSGMTVDTVRNKQLIAKGSL